ncbi:MAG: ribosomal L7Ae/L30e/S12e/Gadd45 family protein [Blautia sp.]|nr:ribosomal L7Ae/L30e/S12e/Gadd45 family protein [Blautia sp.]MCM1201882.1 ribosomal L7Ae/L30e/S12e/Gadd45 family protein [Bacteroides fragilis]
MCRDNEILKKKVLSMLGLAARSRNVVSGGFATENAVKSGKAYLVIVPEDASDNTKKKFQNMCEFYEVPFYQFGEKEMLGHSMGKQERTSLAVTNGGFADSIRKHLKDSGIGRR